MILLEEIEYVATDVSQIEEDIDLMELEFDHITTSFRKAFFKKKKLFLSRKKQLEYLRQKYMEQTGNCDKCNKLVTKHKDKYICPDLCEE